MVQKLHIPFDIKCLTTNNMIINYNWVAFNQMENGRGVKSGVFLGVWMHLKWLSFVASKKTNYSALRNNLIFVHLVSRWGHSRYADVLVQLILSGLICLGDV